MIGPTRVCDVASQLVTGVASAINAATPSSPLHRVLFQFGEVAWDNCQCGLLALTINRTYTSREFPVDTSQQRRGNCDVGYVVVDAQLSVVRCISVEGDDSANPLVTPPKVTDVEAETRLRFVDEYTAWTTLGSMLNQMYEASPQQIAEYLISDATSLGPQGGCGGVVIGFKYGFTRDCAYG